MSGTRTLRKAAIAAVLTLAVVTAGQGTASPTTLIPALSTNNTTSPATGEVHRIEDKIARRLAASLADADWRTQVNATAGPHAIGLQSLTGRTTIPAGRQLAGTVADADQRIADAKGLGTDVGPLLRLQLADPAMRPALDAGQAPLVAASISDDHATTVTAYDTTGHAHALDARELPSRPVFLVDIDASKLLTGGLDVLQAELAHHGIAGAPAGQFAATTAAGWWATKIDAIEVADDQEPWYKGAAEMFALVTGFGHDGKVRVDSVAMPYLQYGGSVYRPNQLLINWSNYKYNLADVVLMEDDGDTNYRALAQAIATALLSITDQGAYVPLVNAVLQAVPDSWWSDDPDYVESWYTLSKGSTGRLNGASKNGWMNVEPYFVQQL